MKKHIKIYLGISDYLSKKLLLTILLLVMSIPIFSQNYSVYKVGYSLKTVGLDFGYVNNNLYTQVDFAFPSSRDYSGYLNFGVGPMLSKNMYLTCLIGLYSDGNDKMYLNAGGEVGYMFRPFVTSLFITNNLMGIKVGFIINENKN